jgi:hypothetical protein
MPEMVRPASCGEAFNKWNGKEQAMPNWCVNELRVHGDNQSLEDLVAFVKGDEEQGAFDFARVIPYPEEFEWIDPKAEQDDERHEHPKYGVSEDGYDWCTKNWGTKWNSSKVVVRAFPRSVIFQFNTAWAPPHPIIGSLARRFTPLCFTHCYFEAGVGYQGCSIYTDGELVDHWVCSISASQTAMQEPHDSAV